MAYNTHEIDYLLKTFQALCRTGLRRQVLQPELGLDTAVEGRDNMLLYREIGT